MQKKLQFLQVSRGIAALAVAVFHCSLNSLLYFKQSTFFDPVIKYGWLGVEYFFVLSGFIITYIHWEDLEKRNNINAFLKKRFIRIYPIYWFIATVMLLYYLFIKKDMTGIVVRVHSVEDIWYLIKCYILFPLYLPRKNFIDSAWTLSYEILFYMVFAICIKLGVSNTKKILSGWAIMILLLHYTNYVNTFTVFRFLFNPLILYFLAGSMIAYFTRVKNKMLKFKLFFSGILLLTAILYVYIRFSYSQFTDQRTDINYSYIMMIMLGLVLWACVTIDYNKIEKKWPPILLLIGDASYSIYLIHIPVVIFFYKFAVYASQRFNISMGKGFLNLLLLFVLLASTAVGILLHLLVEKKLLKFFKIKMLPPPALN